MLLDLLAARYRQGLVDAYRAAPLFDPGDAADAVDPTVAAALARGEPPPEGWEAELRTRLRRVPEVRAALERMWPVLTGAELVHDLFSFTALIRSAADGVLSRDEQRGLQRPRSPSVREVAWTTADVALVDEADALLGPPEEARPRRRRRGADGEALAAAEAVIEELGMAGTVSAAALAERFAEPVAVDPRSAGELRTYGHVVVDEAQDLSAMQWRMLARRVPSASMTVVGDFGQATQPGALGGWDDVLSHLPRTTSPVREPERQLPHAGGDHGRGVAAPGRVAQGVETSRSAAPPGRSRGSSPWSRRPPRGRPGGGGGGGAPRRDRRRDRPAQLHAALEGSLGDLGAVADTPRCSTPPSPCSAGPTPRASSSTTSWWWSRPSWCPRAGAGCGCST